MPRFSRDPRREKMVSVRLTEQQDQVLGNLADAMELGKAELLRRAFDYWQEHAPEAQQAATKAARTRKG